MMSDQSQVMKFIENRSLITFELLPPSIEISEPVTELEAFVELLKSNANAITDDGPSMASYR
jgi:hypothetical protein